MPDHKVGSTYSFPMLRAAYKADPQNDGDPHFLLYRGDEIVALCLKHRFNPEPNEVWVGDDAVTAEWGKKLAALKDTRTLPLYYSPGGRAFYIYKGHHLISDDTTDLRSWRNERGMCHFHELYFSSQLKSAAFEV
jgi:hypothetical protein